MRKIKTDVQLADRMDLDVEIPVLQMPDLPIRTVTNQGTKKNGNNSTTQNPSKPQKKTAQPQVSTYKKTQKTPYRWNKPSRGPTSQKHNNEMELDTELPNIPTRRRLMHKAVSSEPGNSTGLKVNVDFNSLNLDPVRKKQEIVCEIVCESLLQAIYQHSFRRKEICITVCYQCPTTETPFQR